MFAVTKQGVGRFIRNMRERGAKPNRRVEEALHHSPTTAIVDAIILSEIHRMCSRGAELAAAHRTAIQISSHLNAIARRGAQKDLA
jgi:hypothetical protein